MIAQLRRQSFHDRLDTLLADAQRYQDTAYEDGDDDDAVYWFTVAAAVRATIAMLAELR